MTAVITPATNREFYLFAPSTPALALAPKAGGAVRRKKFLAPAHSLQSPTRRPVADRPNTMIKRARSARPMKPVSPAVQASRFRTAHLSIYAETKRPTYRSARAPILPLRADYLRAYPGASSELLLGIV